MSDIEIDNNRDFNLTEFGKITLKSQYCLDGESYQQAYARAAQAFCGGDAALAQRIYDYASKQWFSFATPLLANGGTNRGMPISCFLNYVDDSIEGLTENFKENAFLSTNGGGIGTYWGEVRQMGSPTSRGLDSPGAMAFMHVQNAQTLAYHQGKTRRGSAATYLDISHPEIVEFINMRSSTGGDVHRKNENLHHGVCIPDAFMVAVEKDSSWNLIDPHSKKVVEVVSARDLWIKLLLQRAKLGEPYLFFIDTANRDLPQALKDAGLYIHHSNLCTEIMLPTNKDRTAVCCLSSINIAKMDEWAVDQHTETTFIFDLITMLDNALTVFCEQAPPQLWRAVASVKAERSLGLGTLGFHTYLQQKSIPMDSYKAKELNEAIYYKIHTIAKLATMALAKERGEPSDMVGHGVRNAHLIAIAPNASSSIICGGVSPSIEPIVANIFTQKTRVGSHEVRNKVLEDLLFSYGKNELSVWQSIALNQGSVQHLDFLSKHEKDVFKTAHEIDALVLVGLAADRQKYICQGQSLNIFVPSTITAKDLHTAHYMAWKLGLKSMYYARSSSIKSTSIGETTTTIIEKEPELASCEIGCLACEG